MTTSDRKSDDQSDTGRWGVMSVVWRLTASAAVLIACLFGGRWFLDQAARPFDDEPPNPSQRISEQADSRTATASAPGRDVHDEIASAERLTQLYHELLQLESGSDDSAAPQLSVKPDSIEEALRGLMAGGDASGDGTAVPAPPLPPGAQRIFVDGGVNGHGLAVYRLADRMPESSQAVSQSIIAGGWSRIDEVQRDPSTRWFGRFTHDGQLLLVLCSARAGEDETMIVVHQISPEPEAP